MLHFQPWILLLVVLVGNCGFWLFLFNRINAAGLPRLTTKRIEKLIVFACFAIPLAIGIWERQTLLEWLSSSDWRPRGAMLANLWGTWCVVSGVVLGSMWLESRFWLIPPKQLIDSDQRYIRIGRELESGSTGDRLTTLFSKLPGNQISDLEITRKTLELPRYVAGAEGLTIGHLSDLHFTGQFRIEHYQRVIDYFQTLTPDLIVVTGDLLDYDRYLSWIAPVLGRLSAPHGCVFLLGNHDLRLKNVDALLDEMRRLGHKDVGAGDLDIQAGDLRLYLTGNELPWFNRREAASRWSETIDGNVLRIGVSHTPDQIDWARKHKLDLLLAGHTHGGQARFPGIGPLLAPSMHGSKFASGVFYLPPTLMHVSRGVAGTHPFRWWCPPEISLLTLKNPPKNP